MVLNASSDGARRGTSSTVDSTFPPGFEGYDGCDGNDGCRGTSASAMGATACVRSSGSGVGAGVDARAGEGVMASSRVISTPEGRGEAMTGADGCDARMGKG